MWVSGGRVFLTEGKSGSEDLKTGGREGTHFRSGFGCILNNTEGFGDKGVHYLIFFPLPRVQRFISYQI